MFDFLRPETRKKIIRTTLYGDQEFTLWELEILHTPLVQRLYNLKQLGFADRVFPDAVHSRFNHVLGVAEVAGRMAVQLLGWLERHKDQVFRHASDRRTLLEDARVVEIKGADLVVLVRERVPSIRLLALLHDITHAAFGHTLEDEVQVFSEKHDHPVRQIRFFDALTAQLVYMWCTEAHIRDADPLVLDRLSGLTLGALEFKGWVEELATLLDNAVPENTWRQALVKKLHELEIAFRLLLRLEFIHGEHEQRVVPEAEDLLVSEAIAILDPVTKPLDLVFHRDAFIIDLVGNTICADLLDYGRRDALNAGLKVQFDERLIRYLTVVSVTGQLSPTHDPCLRIALQFFTGKMRHDVLSEMSGVLKARYVIHERVLFHPTKCAAGAVLGTAVQLLGIHELPAWVQVLGDQEFLAELTKLAVYLAAFCRTYQSGEDYVLALASLWGNAPATAELLHTCIQGITGTPSHILTEAQCNQLAERASAARRLCWNLGARRFPKLVFRLRTGVQHSGGATHRTIAEDYSKPQARFELERRVERICNLPVGALVIHCPLWRTSMKLAEVLVVGGDLNKVAKLRNLTDISPEGLGPYESEITAIEEMYKSIWQFHTFIESAWFEKQPVVAWVLEHELGGFPNDLLLAEELAHEPESLFRILATDLKGDVAQNLLGPIIAEMDAKLVGLRNRHEKTPADKREWVRRIIQSVSAPTVTPRQGRLLPKTGGERKD